ncbi:hypothetical protein SDC9_111177 [bioreactor metagenome]|uniref:Uncharacterized protein n=1 Tax=bioreactor metagenome TaxID=1076179 RepID=A0A645BIA0_9ZZZZ
MKRFAQPRISIVVVMDLKVNHSGNRLRYRNRADGHRRTRRDRLRDELVAVGFRASNRRENRAGNHRARVVGDQRNFRAGEEVGIVVQYRHGFKKQIQPGLDLRTAAGDPHILAILDQLANGAQCGGVFHYIGSTVCNPRPLELFRNTVAPGSTAAASAVLSSGKAAKLCHESGTAFSAARLRANRGPSSSSR